MPRIRALLVVGFVILLLTSAAAGDDTYDITLDQSVDVPERTLDTDSGEFTISTIGRYADDGTVEATTSGPEDTTYAIRLIDSEERLRQSEYSTGDGSADFALDRFPVGTYAVVITNQSDAEDVKTVAPFVIYGYTVTQSTPSEVEEDSTLDVELSLTKVDSQVDEPPEGVEVALGNDSTSLTAEASRTSGLNYTAEIDVGSLSPGEYSLYTGVQRDNTVYGEQELIGVDTYSVSVTESTSTETETPEDSTETATETSQGGAGGAPAPGGTATATPEGTTAVTETSTPSTETTAPQDPTATATSAPSSPPTDPSSDNSTATERVTSSPSPTTAVTSTEAFSSTPVTTPLLPDGGVLMLFGGLFALLYRVRESE
jgi:hypothetical protein